MSSPKLIPVISAFTPLTVLTLPSHQLTQVATLGMSVDVPEELRREKDSCWGFEIGRWEQVQRDPAKAKLLRLVFWNTGSDNCLKDGFPAFENMRSASSATVDWFNEKCQTHDFITEKWRKVFNRQILSEVTKEDKKHWKLATFSECIKWMKLMDSGEEERKLKFPVIGQFI